MLWIPAGIPLLRNSQTPRSSEGAFQVASLRLVGHNQQRGIALLLIHDVALGGFGPAVTSLYSPRPYSAPCELLQLQWDHLQPWCKRPHDLAQIRTLHICTCLAMSLFHDSSTHKTLLSRCALSRLYPKALHHRAMISL